MLEQFTPSIAMHQEFMRSIIDAPDDDAPRLIFADWLEDNGAPLRAEHVRAQLRIAAIDSELQSSEDCDEPQCPGCEERRALKRRTEELEKSCFSLLADSCNFLHASYHDGLQPVTDWKFRRGFIESVTVSADGWLEFGSALVKAAPLREVNLTGKSPHYWDPWLYVWSCDERGGSYNDGSRCLPLPIAAFLTGDKMGMNNGPCKVRCYGTVDLARADASLACLLYAKKAPVAEVGGHKA